MKTISIDEEMAREILIAISVADTESMVNIEVSKRIIQFLRSIYPEIVNNFCLSNGGWWVNEM